MDRIVIDLMNCEILFPSVEDKKYFFKFALRRRNLKMIKLLEASGLDIREVIFKDGKSALHYLAEVIYGKNDKNILDPKSKTIKVMEYFLENSQLNYCDNHGYTYFHAACMSGNMAAVNLLLSQGIDVNLDSYKYSALHIAAQYRREEVVEILLRHGADPNKQDVEKSTPLHALARLCLCQCTNAIRFCDYRRPVDKIVQILIEYGANIEARNSDGNSPLDLAVSCFDVQLVKSLLEHGASLDNLNEDIIFSRNFTLLEVKNYPLTLNIIEMVQLLQSVGFKMSFETRLRMLKCWIKVRGNDTDHLIPEYTGPTKDKTPIIPTVYNLFIYVELRLYQSQEYDDFFVKLSDKIRLILLPCFWQEFQIPIKIIDVWKKEAEKVKNNMLNDDVSLYQLCQMNYSDGYSMIKNMKNWRVPAMDDLSHTWINIIVKRHLANIFIRLQLELMVSDLFMSDHCELNLPYVVCRRVAECMSYEELLRLCKETNDKEK
ncbi:uncharacterized protein LOC111693916 [Trichogramma pretiosum]|uniref:uncharacterized protein LOC111693916 n=1 Tax=Trichogramma pretiosum TaxID=7493 RepID=UPI000C71A4AC|nr:uncharacterized protein LOC111693916 [Trichogramma pretiosum]